MLHITQATLQRDLKWLEDQGFLERTHDGARLRQLIRPEPGYAHSAQYHPEEKRRIGAAAAALIEDGDTIFVNGGSTAAQVVRHIRPDSKVTVVTNSVSAALEAQESGCEVILLGGSFRSRSNSVVGRLAIQMLRKRVAHKAFIGVDGISPKFGCTTPVSAEAEMARVMIARTHGRVVVVADHSKWGVVSNFEIAPIDKIHTLVTDDGLDAGARAELTARSVDVLVAGSYLNTDGK